jgi:hypothetical protein
VPLYIRTSLASQAGNGISFPLTDIDSNCHAPISAWGSLVLSSSLLPQDETIVASAIKAPNKIFLIVFMFLV